MARTPDATILADPYAPLGIEDLRVALEDREADILPLIKSRER